MKPYIRKVQYYETDMMGIAHHANYLHWMEEARIDFMDQLGYPYARMEADGFMSPVRAVSCQYKRPCTFGDELSVTVSVESFNGVLLTLRYDLCRAATGGTVCEARSEHVITNREGRLIRVKRDLPGLFDALTSVIQSPD